jgi:nitroreductase/NAD-dependent dihydropyrimidine dehydrogenase PreA subunit
MINNNEQLNCTKCGICVDVCPLRIIRMRQNGAKLMWPGACIHCGHCVAVCPRRSFVHEKIAISDQVSLEGLSALSSEDAARLLRARRSIRCYKKDDVSKEKCLELLDIARFAPSPNNQQGISYIVITNRELLKKITDLTIQWMDKQLKDNVECVKPYAGIVKTYYKTGRDVILRDAPNLVIATASRELTTGRDSSRYSLAYAELYAPSLGLGTCWAGFFEMCAFAGYCELLELLNIEEGKVVTGAIMLGYPKYTYYRLVDRNPLEITWK